MIQLVAQLSLLTTLSFLFAQTLPVIGKANKAIAAQVSATANVQTVANTLMHAELNSNAKILLSPRSIELRSLNFAGTEETISTTFATVCVSRPHNRNASHEQCPNPCTLGQIPAIEVSKIVSSTQRSIRLLATNTWMCVTGVSQLEVTIVSSAAPTGKAFNYKLHL